MPGEYLSDGENHGNIALAFLIIWSGNSGQSDSGQTMTFVRLALIFVTALLAGCASNGANPLADMPYSIGGLPPDAPPRPGTPAYEAWQAERAREAERPKR